MNLAEKLGNERYYNLKMCIDCSFERMRADFIVKQLHIHPETHKFISNRLSEIVSESIDDDREAYIRKLEHDIGDSSQTKDKINEKILKLRYKKEMKHQDANKESIKLRQMKEGIDNEIINLQRSIDKSTFDHKTKAKQIKELTKKSNCNLLNIKKEIRQIKNGLTSTKECINDLFSLAKIEITNRCNEIKHVTYPIVSMDSIDDSLQMEISMKESILNECKSKNNNYKESLNTIINDVNFLAASKGINERVYLETIDDIELVLNKYINAEVEMISNQLSIGETNVQITKLIDDYQNKLREKEREYDKLISEAKKRRADLKLQLSIALKKIDSLMDHQFSSDDQIVKDLRKTRHEYETNTQSLDETLNLLVSHSSRSGRTILSSSDSSLQ